MSTVFSTPFSTWISLGKIPLKVSEAVVRRCSSKYVVWKVSQILHEIPVSQSLYNQDAGPRIDLQLDYKETPTQEFSCDICKIIKNTFFHRTPPMAASTADLQTKDLLHKSYRKTSVTASFLQIMFLASTMQLYLKKRLWPRSFPVKFANFLRSPC